MKDKIKEVQAFLREGGIDGWLLYDFQKRNTVMMKFLEIPESLHLTRRLFYWIPSKGNPVKIVHATETHVLDSLPGDSEVYFRRETLLEHLQKTLRGVRKIAMEYSHIPYISFVDGGTLDLIREIGPEVVSSAGFILPFTCLLTLEQRESHKRAAEVLDETAAVAWAFLSDRLKRGEKVTERDVQELMRKEIERKGCHFEGALICAANAHSANPHYVPDEENSAEIRKGDFVQIDLWCKERKPDAVYADISRVAVAEKAPSSRRSEIFSYVLQAQRAAMDLVRDRFLKKEPLYGYEVDRAARDVIERAGYGAYFIHRTGHNIYTQDHGPGTHMDGLETFDDRPVLPGMCFSIEPGVYLPGEFGIRLEHDVYVSDQGDPELTGGVQEAIVTLL